MQSNEEQLISAVKKQQIHTVKRLIQEGINVNYRDPRLQICALDEAGNQGNCDIINLLLRAGAQVDGIRISRKYDDAIHYTLTKAKFKANVSIDHTPLMRAVMNGHVEAVTTFVEAGADVSFTSFDPSRTSLEQAIAMNNLPQTQQIAMIKALLPAADRINPLLRKTVIGIVEAHIRKHPGGEYIYVNSAGEPIAPTGADLRTFKRNQLIAPVLREFATARERLRAIPHFSETKLSTEDRGMYDTFCDPLTLEIIHDPFKTASGQLYDRQSLEDYFSYHMDPKDYPTRPKSLDCPITSISIQYKELSRARTEEETAIKHQIDAFVTRLEQRNFNITIPIKKQSITPTPYSVGRTRTNQSNSRFLIACVLAAAGITLVVVAFAVLDASTLGIPGLCMASLGAAAILAGLGLYRSTPRAPAPLPSVTSHLGCSLT